MEIKNIRKFGGSYLMVLNIPHRRLIVDDKLRMFDVLPQKKVYPSTGCLLLSCPFHHLTCDLCSKSYDVLEL